MLYTGIMLFSLILQIIVGTLGIFLASRFVPGVSLDIIPGQSNIFGISITEMWQMFLVVGTILGLINFFIKPILQIIFIPVRILTLGLFSLVINMALIWIVDLTFAEFVIQGLIPLFWTTTIIWLLSLIARAYDK